MLLLLVLALSVQFVLSIHRRQCLTFFRPTVVCQVKEQLGVRFLPQFLCHIGNLNLLGRATFEPVENNLDGCQSVSAS